MRVDWLITLPTPVFLVLRLTASTRMGKRNPTPDQRQQLAHVDRLEEARCHAERRDLMLHFLGARRDDDWNRVFHLPDPKAVHERKLQIEQDETRWCGALQPIDCLLTIGGGKELVGLPPQDRRQHGADLGASRPARWVRSSGGSARNVPPSVLYQPGPMQSRRAGDWREKMGEPNPRGPHHWARATGPCSE